MGGDKESNSIRYFLLLMSNIKFDPIQQPAYGRVSDLFNRNIPILKGVRNISSVSMGVKHEIHPIKLTVGVITIITLII